MTPYNASYKIIFAMHDTNHEQCKTPITNAMSITAMTPNQDKMQWQAAMQTPHTSDCQRSLPKVKCTDTLHAMHHKILTA